MSDFGGDMGRFSICGKITGFHVVAMPYPGRGHINPMMNICKLLVSKLRDDDIVIKITFVVTEEWVGFIGSEPRPPQIQLRSIPNVIPSELVRGSDHSGFIESVFTKMEAPFEQLLDQLESPVTAIISDTLLSWAVSIGNRRNIPVVSLWPMSPSVFSVFYHFDLLSQNGHFPVDVSEHGDDELIDYIPGVSPTRLADMPSALQKTRVQVAARISEAFTWVRKAQCLLLASFHELEPQVTETLMAILPFPVYPVGPCIPHYALHGISTNETDKQIPFSATANPKINMEYYLKWLDCQPKSSVLYVSFGSFLSFSREEMEEILAGLLESGVRYLLVSRGDHTSGVSDDQIMNSSTSLVVPWCDQLRVLCHSSVAGFWTHCGWNSTLEGVFAGVPMVTSPVGLEQFLNRKLIVDDWKVGLRVRKEQFGTKRSVNREEVVMIVKRFMDLDGDESREMRRRAGELKESCRRALAKGGSSDTNLNAFIRNIFKCHI